MDTGTSDHTELLRWWHQYQAHMLNQETDFVRNGLLQEIIAIRRRLETSCPVPTTPTAATERDPHLADLKRLYGLLEDFCDRLESPFLQDSLPLAIQHVAQPWQHRLNLQLILPPAWPPDPIEQARLLTLLVKAILTTLADDHAVPHQTVLTMTADAGTKTLVLEARYADNVPDSAMAATLRQEIEPFVETFQLFTQADRHDTFEADRFFLKLNWSDSKTTAPNHHHGD